MKLSDKTVKNAKATDKPVRMWDGEGMYLEVTTTGSKLWRLKYRLDGKEKLFALGSYPILSLKEARERRFLAKKQIADGIDPSKARKIRLTASDNIFESVARAWVDQQSGSWAESYTTKVIGRLEKDVFKVIGKTPIETLTPTDLLCVLRKIEARGVLETAHRVLTCMGQIFRYAVSTGIVPYDPSRDLRGALPPVKENHFAAITEPDEVGGLLRMIHGYPGSDVVSHALKLASLVFVRPGELRQAEWKDIDFKAAEWRFAASKTGQQHIVPLSRQAVEILNSIKETTGEGRYVFPSLRSKNAPMSDNAILAAFRRMDIPSETMCGHGFRAMARTLLDEVLKFPPHLIEHQLAHAVKDPLGRAYNRTTHLEERKAMMQRWADYLDELRAKKGTKDEQ